MPRVKSKPEKVDPSTSTYPNSSAYSTSSSSSTSAGFSVPPLLKGTKRRLNYDDLVEEGSSSEASRNDASEAKRRRTRSSQPSTSAERVDDRAIGYRTDIEYADAELPGNAWVVSDLDWTVVTNTNYFTEIKPFDSSLYFESREFRQFLEIPGLEVMGNINLRLQCGQTIHIEDAVYIDSAKFNVISIQSLREQKASPLEPDSNYSLGTDKDHLYLVDKEDGERIRLTRRVANRIVLLTEKPSIEEVTKHAEANRVPEMRNSWVKYL